MNYKELTDKHLPTPAILPRVDPELPGCTASPVMRLPVLPIITNRTHIEIGELIRVCPGKRHAWFKSNVGSVRKPISPAAPKP